MCTCRACVCICLSVCVCRITCGGPRTIPRSRFSPFTYTCSRDQTQVIGHSVGCLYPEPSCFPDRDISYGTGGYRTLISAPRIKPNVTNARMCLRSVVEEAQAPSPSPSLAVARSCVPWVCLLPSLKWKLFKRLLFLCPESE